MAFIAVGGVLGPRRIGERRRSGERETHGDLSDRTALGNCGFELACTISRCLLRPCACTAAEGGGGSRDQDSRGSEGGVAYKRM